MWLGYREDVAHPLHIGLFYVQGHVETVNSIFNKPMQKNKHDPSLKKTSHLIHLNNLTEFVDWSMI